ncbi:MAG TPA: ATP-binding protein [Thermoanaerobaculia bacterium]|nr:ATP-binding protein [Thermoanaerobaculia bacterium]
MSLELERTIRPPTIAAVTAFGAELDRWAAELGLGDDARRRLLLAWDELASNVVRHARGASELRVGLRPEADGGVTLVLEDDGEPFDPLDRPEPETAAPLERRQPGGLGIHLVRQLFDRVVYRRRGGRNRLQVELSGASGAPERLG